MSVFDTRPSNGQSTLALRDNGSGTLIGTLHVSAALAFVRDARAFVRRVLREQGIPETVVDDAVLVVSELLTNAALHGSVGVEPEATLKLITAGSRLRIEVHDRSPLGPVERAEDDDAEGGRGLLVVRALVDRWGWAPTPAGKFVWCEMAAWLGQTTTPHA